MIGHITYLRGALTRGGQVRPRELKNAPGSATAPAGRVSNIESSPALPGDISANTSTQHLSLTRRASTTTSNPRPIRTATCRPRSPAACVQFQAHQLQTDWRFAPGAPRARSSRPWSTAGAESSTPNRSAARPRCVPAARRCRYHESCRASLRADCVRRWGVVPHDRHFTAKAQAQRGAKKSKKGPFSSWPLCVLGRPLAVKLAPLSLHTPRRARLNERPRKDMELIAELVPPGARVLDLGCGNGELLAHLRTHRGLHGSARRSPMDGRSSTRRT